MIIFLYGKDTYRSRQKLNEIIDHYKKIHKSGLNLKFFDGKNLDFQDFKQELQITPMFKEKKLIILTNIFQNQNFKEKFLKESKRSIDFKGTILFYEENEIFPKDSFLKFLKQQAKCQEFSLLERFRLKNWIEKELEKYKLQASPQVLKKLIDFVGNDLWQLSNEIKKLASFKKAVLKKYAAASQLRKKISEKDIELLIRPKIETDIFKTIDFIALKNKKGALEQVHRHLEKGDSLFYLLSMINYQFRNILEIKDLIERKIPYYKIFKKSNLHPFVFRKSYSLAKKFTKKELKKIYQKIFEVDLKIKTGRIDPKTALDLLIAEI